MQFRTTRFPADSPVRVIARGGEQIGALRNISVQGVSIAGLHGLRRGDAVDVMLTGQASRATVMWARGGACGMRLSRPLSEPEMCLIRGIPVSLRGTGPGARTPPSKRRFHEM